MKIKFDKHMFFSCFIPAVLGQSVVMFITEVSDGIKHSLYWPMQAAITAFFLLVSAVSAYFSARNRR